MTTDASRAEARPAPPSDAREMLARGRSFLERKGVPEFRLDAELLVAHALGTNRLGLFLRLDQPVLEEEVEAARGLLVRRAAREPVAYLVGEREFYGRPFVVGPGVLVPRPETELIVDRARAWAAQRGAGRPARILDVGTGSGCLAVTLALELGPPRTKQIAPLGASGEAAPTDPSAQPVQDVAQAADAVPPVSEGDAPAAGVLDPVAVFAVDLSERALEFARENARRLGASVSFRQSDGLQAVGAGQPFDLIVSNPPYVDPEQRASLAPEVRDHEPSEALFAPPGDPDHWVKRLLAEALPRVAPGGRLLIELGADQGERALALGRSVAPGAQVHADLAGLPRVLEIPG